MVRTLMHSVIQYYNSAAHPTKNCSGGCISSLSGAVGLQLSSWAGTTLLRLSSLLVTRYAHLRSR